MARRLLLVPRRGSAVAQVRPSAALLLFVRLSSERVRKRCVRTAPLPKNRSLPMRSRSSSKPPTFGACPGWRRSTCGTAPTSGPRDCARAGGHGRARRSSPPYGRGPTSVAVPRITISGRRLAASIRPPARSPTCSAAGRPRCAPPTSLPRCTRPGARPRSSTAPGLRARKRPTPNSGDLRDTRGTPYPPASAVIRTCGSLRAALAKLGWHAAWTPVADAEILDALRAYAREHGRAPTCAVWRNEHHRPGASLIIRRHGSWSSALAASLGPDGPTRQSARHALL